MVKQRQTERRLTPNAELRIAGSGALIGYAAVFDQWSEDLGSFKEKIQRGAFRKTIKESDIRALFNHNPDKILGRVSNDTLRLWEDNTGLGFEVQLPDTSYAKDLRMSIKRKDVTQCSFGFQMIHDRWDEGHTERTLTECRLLDVSPVTFPAYVSTSVSARSQPRGEERIVRSRAAITQQMIAELLRGIRGG